MRLARVRRAVCRAGGLGLLALAALLAGIAPSTADEPLSPAALRTAAELGQKALAGTNAYELLRSLTADFGRLPVEEPSSPGR